MLINDYFKMGYMQGYKTGFFENKDYENMTDEQQKAFNDGYEKGVSYYCLESNL